MSDHFATKTPKKKQKKSDASPGNLKESEKKRKVTSSLR